MSSTAGRTEQIAIAHVDFSFVELFGWRRMLDNAGIPGVWFSDVDEKRNRVVLGMATHVEANAARSFVPSLGIPESAVEMEVSPPTRLLSLSQPVRPTSGGVLVRNNNNTPCTSGFNLRRTADPGKTLFLMNSHCSVTWFSSDGGAIYQPTKTAEPQRIGKEHLDKATFTNAVDPDCPASPARCRYSDAAIGVYDDTVSYDFGYIARTTFIDTLHGSTTIDSNNSRLRITAEIGSPLQGDSTWKIGSTGGWTKGIISRTNLRIQLADANGLPTNYHILGAWEVDNGAFSGDSGAPVFGRISGNDVSLFGILFAGNSIRYHFSPLSAIEEDYGNITVVGP